MPALLETRVTREEAKRLDQVLDPFEEGAAFLAEHSDELIDQYEDQWVAIHRAKVVAHGKTRLGLKRTLSRLSIPASQLYVAFLTRKRQTLIL